MGYLSNKPLYDELKHLLPKLKLGFGFPAKEARLVIGVLISSLSWVWVRGELLERFGRTYTFSIFYAYVLAAV